MISLFLVCSWLSESILGLIPPDILLLGQKYRKPSTLLGLLAFLSYLGGVIAYFMGMAIAAVPSVNRYLYGKMAKHIINMQKMGRLLIAVELYFRFLCNCLFGSRYDKIL